MLTNPFKDLRDLGLTTSSTLIKDRIPNQMARGYIFLWPHTFQFRDSVPIKGQEDFYSSGHIPSSSKTSYLSRGKRIYFPLAMYLQIHKFPSQGAMTHWIW